MKGEEREAGVNIFSADSYLLLALSGECVCVIVYVCLFVVKGLHRSRALPCPVKECAETKRTPLTNCFCCLVLKERVFTDLLSGMEAICCKKQVRHRK